MALPTCPNCGGNEVIRKGLRQNQYRAVPLYQCKACQRYFSGAAIAGVKYPPHIILKALSLYHLGHAQESVARLLAAQHHIKVPQRTVSSWILRYSSLCTFGKLRARATRLYKPTQMIARQTMQHRQVYAYQLHRAKLDLLEGNLPRAEDYRRLRVYLLSVLEPDYPHHLFAGNDAEVAELPVRRSSQLALRLLPLRNRRKENLANRLAALGLLLAKTRKLRHKEIQDFMLVNDNATLACEVPVYLAAEHVRYFKGQGFHMPVAESDTPVTGHIDLLQVRQGLIHILDYKPDARKLQPISQLTLYALALASHTRLPLKLLRCAWFDEQDYFEFNPLAAVYKKAGTAI